MFCRMVEHQGEIPVELPFHSEGRFVLHRHKDKQGIHLDLRIEQKGYLLGWRIDSTELQSELWGVEKLPHSSAWLDTTEHADLVHSGDYRWFSHGDGNGYLVLRLENQVQRVYHIERWAGFSLRFQRALWQSMRKWQVLPAQVISLIEDGVEARNYAIQRLCGLGKFLEGDCFDSSHWEKVLSQCSLSEIHAYLKKWEDRFEKQSPPERLSRPEKVDESWSNEAESHTSQSLLHLILGQEKQNSSSK